MMDMPHKMKSRKELHAEISRLERMLENEKEEISDNFRLGNIIIGLLPEFLRVDFKPDQEVNVWNYLSNMAGNFISFQDKKK